MEAAVIIPARLAARRLPRKPLAMIGQLPLVVRVLQQAERCKEVDIVAVATDSPEIAQVVTEHGGRAIMTHPDHPSGTDRVAEAARALGCEIIINVQGDEPFIDPVDIDAIASSLKQGDSSIVTLKTPIEDPQELQDPNVVKVVTTNDNVALYFSRAPIPFTRDGKPEPGQAFRHIGVYGYRQHVLEQLTQAPPHYLEEIERLEQLRALAMGFTITVLPARSSGRGIDTEDDLAWARQRVLELGQDAFPA